MDNRIRLHLGCGKRNFGPDWDHIDGNEFPHLKSHDVTKLPYTDESVDIVYASHLIAYFDRADIAPILQEWKRVLKPGGTIRLATTDFAQMKECYFQLKNLDKLLGPMYGKWPVDGGFVYHKTIYDVYSLKAILDAVGFVDIRRYDHRCTEHPNTGDFSDTYDDHSAAYINGVLISLNMEATKP